MKVITFGRSRHNQVVFNDPSVSRVHCQIIQHDNGSYSIADFKSLNGTFVNGRRVFGESPLSPGDSVRIGNVRLNWQSYFGGAPSAKFSSAAIIAIVLGVVVTLIVVVLVVGLGHNKNQVPQQQAPIGNSQGPVSPAQPPAATTQQTETIPQNNHQIKIGDVGLDIGMSMDDVRRTNPKATISNKRQTPGIDDICYTIPSVSYHTINNDIVALLGDNNRVRSVLTWSPLFNTTRGCHVGSTWGDIQKKYPKAIALLEYNLFNYKSLDYDDYYCLWDEQTKTLFYFHRSQFTEKQLSAIDDLGGSDFEMVLDLNALPSDVYKSICSNVKVIQIEVSK
jgi:hypothetical protein